MLYTIGLKRNVDGDLKKSFIESKREEREIKRKAGRIYPSDAKCDRKSLLLSLAFEGKINPPKIHTSATGEMYKTLGIAIEKEIIDGLYKSGKLLFSGYHLPELDYLNLGGIVDAIIILNGKIYGLEIKSCGTMPKTIKSEHKAQVAIYSVLLGLPMIVLYQSRNVVENWTSGLSMEQFVYTSNPLQTIKKICRMQASMEMCILPTIGKQTQSSTVCKRCSFNYYCWTDPKSIYDYEVSKTLELDKMETRTQELVDRIFNETEVRRNGILKHISKHGTTTARKLLENSNWSDFLFDK
jgi:hypothetical protein